MAHDSQARVQAGTSGTVPPRTPYEEAVAAIWRDILGRPDVGALDDFFSLDATSLQAIQVVSRIRKTLGVDIPVKDVFQEPTVAALAARVQAESASGRGALTRRTDGADPVLSFDQERLWLESQLLPPTAYNVHGRRRLVGPVDTAVLEAAVAAIVARHDALRTRFPVVGGQPAQVVDPPDAGWRLETARAEGPAAALLLADRQATTAFDLATGPLFRCLLVTVDADGEGSGDEDGAEGGTSAAPGAAGGAEPEYLLSVTVHHIVADAWSVGLFVRELLALYAVGGDPALAGLPDLAVQYPDFAVWQREQLAAQELTGQLTHWREHLAGAPPTLAMPVSRRLATPGGGVERARAALTAEESADLGDLRRKHGATTFMVLLAALGATLGRWSGRRDVVVGVPIAGRSDAGTHALIGFFVNTLPVRVNLRGDPSFGDLLARVRQAALDGYANADVPFDVLVKELKAPRDPRQTPLFQALLNVIGAPESEVVAGITVEPLEIPALPSKFDLALTAQESDGRLHFDLAFNADRYHGSMMRELLAQTVAVVRGALDDPERALSEFGPEAGPGSGAAPGAMPGPGSESVNDSAPHLAVDCFARLPDRTAVAGADGEHGYRWLARAADRVAAFLAAQDAEPGRVGIARRPTAAFVATVLGCLKAGVEFTVTEPAVGVPASFLGLSQLLDTEETEGLDAAFDGIDDTADGADTAPSADSAGATDISAGTAAPAPDWAAERFGFAREDRFAAPATSPGLLVSALSSALSTGATLVLSDLTAADGIGELAGWLRAQAVSVLYTAPPLIRALAAADVRLPVLQFALVDNAGDFLPHDVEAAALVSPMCRCVSLYRVGQNGRPLAVYAVPDDFTVQSAPLRVPLGTGTAVLPHPSGRPAAVGEIAEIRAGGLRTGDLGRWRADGVLEYTGLAGADPGRDLAETASALRDVAEVRDALVTEQVGEEGDTVVVAYLVGPDAGAGTSGIRRYLVSRLPEWLIPHALVIMDALPLTAEGDHDVAALPRTDPGAAAEEYTAPRTPMEQQLVEVMTTLLAVDRIGVHDTFFELGGFSLLATRLTSRIRDMFDVELSLRDVFEAPTVEGLAQLIVRAQGEAFGGEDLEGLLAEITAG